MKNQVHNMIRVFCMILALLLSVSLIACSDDPAEPADSTEGNTQAVTEAPTQAVTTGGNDPTPTPDPEPDWKQYEQTLQLNSNVSGVKLLGVRSAASSTQLNCDWVGSGLEFTYQSKGGDVVLRTATSDPCNFRVWVDGEAWKNSDGSLYYTINGVRNMTITGISEGEHTVRVIRVSEPELAEAHFFNLVFYGTLSAAPAASQTYVEFVAGADALGLGLSGATSGKLTTDGSLGYAYLTAEKLGADYSVTALNGVGLLSGDHAMASAYLQSSPLRSGSGAYGFGRGANMVVVDLGNADFAANISTDAFSAAYIDFLRTVYAKNGTGCRIYCVYSSLDQSYVDAIAAATALLGGEAAGIFTLQLSAPAAETLTAQEQADRAAALAAYITETKDLPLTDEPGLPDGYLQLENLGSGEELDYSDSAWND